MLLNSTQTPLMLRRQTHTTHTEKMSLPKNSQLSPGLYTLIDGISQDDKTGYLVGEREVGE